MTTLVPSWGKIRQTMVFRPTETGHSLPRPTETGHSLPLGTEIRQSLPSPTETVHSLSTPSQFSSVDQVR